ncbi:putative ankyrin repeat protein RF_0381 [Artemia franciscana]
MPCNRISRAFFHLLDYFLFSVSNKKNILLKEMKKKDTKLNILQKQLRKGADPNLKDLKDRKEYTALHYAAERGRLDICQLLLNNRGDPNIQDFLKRTALHFAALRGTLDVCQLLLSNRADPNIKDLNKKTALHYAAAIGTLDVCQLLLSNGADLNLKDSSKQTALHYAAKKGTLDVCQLLLSNWADPNLKDSSKKTALHYAAEEGTLDICQLLLSKGADPNVEGSVQFETTLVIALFFFHIKKRFAIAKYILENDTLYYSLVTPIDAKIMYQERLREILHYTRKLPPKKNGFGD